MRLEAAVEASAPTRIDLAGGTVDLWPLYLFHPGSVTVNAAIDLRAWVRVTPRKGDGIQVTDRDADRTIDWRGIGQIPASTRYELFRQALTHFSVTQGLSLQFHSEVPKGAGLAGSSALLLAFCGALMRSAGQAVRRDRFLELVRDIETRLIRVPAGMQDYYPALWGGVQALWWKPGGVSRESLPARPRALEKRLLLVYTGTSRLSATNNWEVFKRHLDGDRRIHRLFERIAEAGRETAAALRKGDYAALGRAMAGDAAARRRLFPGIVTRETDRLERALRPIGAICTKVCGAGGGGCVVVYADPDRTGLLGEKIRDMGFRLLPFKIAKKGLSFRRTGKDPPGRFQHLS